MPTGSRRGKLKTTQEKRLLGLSRVNNPVTSLTLWASSCLLHLSGLHEHVRSDRVEVRRRGRTHDEVQDDGGSSGNRSNHEEYGRPWDNLSIT